MNIHLASLVASLALVVADVHAHAAASLPSIETPTDLGSDSEVAPDSTGRRIEGLWDEHITLLNCATGAVLNSFRSTNMFGRDGSLTAINNLPPSSNTPATGTWSNSRSGLFVAQMRGFRFNPDGSYAGFNQVSRRISVVAGSGELNGSITFQVFDANDHLLQSACGTEEGTRVSR